MVHGAKGGGRARPRGPVGGAKGRKYQKASQLYLPAASSTHGKKILASIYFAVDEHSLDGDDTDVLRKVAVHCLERLLKAEDVTLRIHAHADTRASDAYNLELSQRRGSEVERFFQTVSIEGSPRLPEYRAFRTSFIPLGERFGGNAWADDRRVDVIDVSPVLPAKEERGLFYYMKNQNIFRALYFKHYYPRYWLWERRKLEYLVDLGEKEGAGLQEFLKIRPADYDKVLEIIEQLADYNDYQKILRWSQTGDRKEVIATAYEVEYRKAWDEAEAIADRKFLKSDFRYPWEFFAIEFGLVPQNTPRHKRPKGSEPVNFGSTPTYYKGIKGH